MATIEGNAPSSSGQLDEHVGEKAVATRSFCTSHRVSLIVLALITLGAIGAEIWLGGVLFADETNGVTQIGRLVFGLILTTLITLFAVETLVRAVRKKHQTAAAAKKHHAHYARLHSVLPIIRSVIFIFAVAMFFLFVLDEAGVNLAPVLTSAGVFGVALSLGAQSIVKDVLSGLFYLAEDAFRVGDYVKIDDKEGVIERVLLRSVQLRRMDDGAVYDGSLHTIPYSQIETVNNLSRDWIGVNLYIVLPHETDSALVKRLVAEVSSSMQDDAAFRKLLVKPLETLGIEDMNELGVNYMLRFETRAGSQFDVRREMLLRLKTLLDQHDIPYARPAVEVLDGPSAQAAKAAAAGR